jgi:hypothetical protein
LYLQLLVIEDQNVSRNKYHTMLSITGNWYYISQLPIKDVCADLLLSPIPRLQHREFNYIINTI